MFEGFSFQIRKNDIPKRQYSSVHTGPNTQLGGLKEGLFNKAYQVGTACDVNIPATAPIVKGNANETSSLTIFFLSILIVDIH